MRVPVYRRSPRERTVYCAIWRGAFAALVPRTGAHAAWGMHGLTPNAKKCRVIHSELAATTLYEMCTIGQASRSGQ